MGWGSSQGEPSLENPRSAFEQFKSVGKPGSGKGGIRTHVPLLAVTRSPGEPIQPLSHLSGNIVSDYPVRLKPFVSLY